MKSLARTMLAVPSHSLLHTLMRASRRIAGAIGAYLIASRKAKAAEELFRHLSRLPDQELATRGLDRKRLAQIIAERLG
jgi:hypothetical protein